MITSKQRAQLRGLAMSEDTIIQIGKGGITEAVVESVNAALKARELVKGKVLENSMLTAREACDALCEACRAEGVQVIRTKTIRTTIITTRGRTRTARMTGSSVQLLMTRLLNSC